VKIELGKDVYQAALDRIRWLYDEFPNVVVSYSGGKDSTVILELTVQVAAEKGRLPVEALFIDQEGEWTFTIDLMRTIAARDDVKLHWLQIPMQIFNATSEADEWLWCWEEGKDDQWLRPKEPGSIHENVLGTTRFGEMFPAFLQWRFGEEPAAQLNGVRAEESPGRTIGLTTWPCYRHITWGNRIGATKKRQQITFSPIYDWRYLDVWKAIHDHGWPYNQLYDRQYQHGVGIRNMRVSSLHHETAVRSLEYAHEVDADLWNRLTERLQGVNTAKHLQADFRTAPKVLPPMFVDWREYRDYLLDHLITNEDHKVIFRRRSLSGCGACTSARSSRTTTTARNATCSSARMRSIGGGPGTGRGSCTATTAAAPIAQRSSRHERNRGRPSRGDHPRGVASRLPHRPDRTHQAAPPRSFTAPRDAGRSGAVGAGRPSRRERLQPELRRPAGDAAARDLDRA
jgi:predicted phosphoadenosine phosphosulfate sulfurtransferase